MNIMIHTKSFRKGILAMPNQIDFFKPKYWKILFRPSKRNSIHIWTPVWHEGRGPYIMISIKCFYISRGY